MRLAKIRVASFLALLMSTSCQDGAGNDRSGALPVHEAVRLTHGQGANSNASWSSDGRTLAYDASAGPAAGRQSTHLLDVAAKSTVAITSGQRDQAPKWSPDGQWLVFGSYRDGNAEIYRMRADGTALTRLTNDPHYDSGAEWSPDGKYIIWFAGQQPPSDEDDYGEAEIWRMDTDRDDTPRIVVQRTDGRFSRLLRSATAPIGSVRWSPDGRRLAFAIATDGGEDVVVTNADGSTMQVLTRNAGRNFNPAWSPDGLRLAFTSTRDGNAELYVMQTDGSAVRRLTAQDGTVDLAAWHPDGRRLAFVSNRTGNADIFVMDLDSERPRNITDHESHDSSPAWSPDGGRLAFVSRRTGNAEICLATPRQ